MSLFTRISLPANSPFGIAPAAWISRVTAETLGKQTASPGCFDEPAGDHARRRIPDRIDAGGERRGLHVNPPRGRLEREFDGRAEPARHRQAGYHPLVIVSKIPFPRDTQVSSTSWPGKGSAANVISKPDAAAGRRFTSTSLVIISLSCVFVRNVSGRRILGIHCWIPEPPCQRGRGLRRQVGRSTPCGAGQSSRMLGVFYRSMEGGLRVFRVIARRRGRERARNSHHEALL